jgi:hypothetical protein
VVVRSGRPRALQVVARRTGRHRTIARARTSAQGFARLVFTGRRTGRLKVSVSNRPGCAPAYLRVTAAR